MSVDRFKKLLVESYPELLSKEVLDKLAIYYQLLVEENSKYNLTAIRNTEEIVIKHFWDSLIYDHYLGIDKDEHLKIIDIGTGAGFPGLVLAILNPGSSFTLVDSINKKVNFIKMVVSSLDLKNVEALNIRSETLGQDSKYRQSYDLAVARSVAYLPVLSEYLLPLVKVGGKMVLAKEVPFDEELSEASNALSVLGGEFYSAHSYQLPRYNNMRALIFFNKTKPTPKAYPRREGLPKKKPL